MSRIPVSCISSIARLLRFLIPAMSLTPVFDMLSSTRFSRSVNPETSSTPVFEMSRTSSPLSKPTVKSNRKKTNAKLKKCSLWLKKNRHKFMVHELIKRLNQSLIGYYNYYAVSDNVGTLSIFRHKVIRLLYYWLNRRSQKKSYTWESFYALTARIPIVHPRLRHRLY